MVMKIAAVAFFGALFYLGVFKIPHILGSSQAVKKGLDFVENNEIAEYGDIDTLVVTENTIKDEAGEIDAEAIEIITMLGHIGTETVLVSEKNEKAGDEMARRLGAVRCIYNEKDYMAVISRLENEGRKVLYAEDLLAAEEAVELGKSVKKTVKTNGVWTAVCGVLGVLAAETIGIVIFAIINLLAVIIASLKIIKE